MRDPLWNEEGLVLLRARIYEYPSQNNVFSHTRFNLGSYCIMHLFCFSFFLGLMHRLCYRANLYSTQAPIFLPIIPHTPFLHSLMSFCYASGHHSEDFFLLFHLSFPAQSFALLFLPFIPLFMPL